MGVPDVRVTHGDGVAVCRGEGRGEGRFSFSFRSASTEETLIHAVLYKSPIADVYCVKSPR